MSSQRKTLQPVLDDAVTRISRCVHFSRAVKEKHRDCRLCVSKKKKLKNMGDETLQAVGRIGNGSVLS